MATGKKFYWLKLSRDFFKRHDIRIIESQENGKDYILFYLKLLVESIDHEGQLRFSDTVPYDEKMLSIITNTNVDIVRQAIKMFTELKLMEIFDDRTIYMSETAKMLGYETDYAKKMREYRENKDKAIGYNVANKYPPSSHDVRQEIELEKELDKEKEKDIKDIVEDKSSMSVDTDDVKVKTSKINYSSIAEYWNTHSFLKEITVVTDKRKGLLNGRIKEHGLKAIFKAIDNVGKSPFLKGENKQSWIANFDWVFRPNNFVKVLEGNYLDAESKSNHTLESDIERRMRLINERLGKEDDARTSFSN